MSFSNFECYGEHSQLLRGKCLPPPPQLRKRRLIIPSQQRWRGYSNAAVRLWLGEWVGAWVRPCVSPSVRRALPFGHDTDYSFCPITFKLHMLIVHDERRNPIDLGSQGQISRSTLAPYEGMHALCCLVCVAPFMAVDTCIQPRAVEDHNIELTKVWKLNSKVWKLLMSSSQAIFFFNVPSFLQG